MESRKTLKRRVAGLIAIALMATLVPMTALAGADYTAQAHKTVAKKPTPAIRYVGKYRLIAKADFLKGKRENANGTYNVAVEIPTGTSAKWETSSTATHQMFWEFKKGKPRIVSYLPYVGNYGSLANSKAEDGDPLDVLILGPAVTRGTIQKVHIIGIAKVLDGGEQDDKLIAVMDGTPLGDVRSLAELDANYVGVTDIVRTWFTNYKGPGEMEFVGWGDATEAQTRADSVPAFTN